MEVKEVPDAWLGFVHWPFSHIPRADFPEDIHRQLNFLCMDFDEAFFLQLREDTIYLHLQSFEP